MAIIISGSYGFIKKKILDYCLLNFELQDIWMIDSMQAFDPYYLSRIDCARARRLLSSMKISRPFTFYQLRSKAFTLGKMQLGKDSAIIISCIDQFNNDILDKNELHFLSRSMIACIRRVSKGHLLIGIKGRDNIHMIKDNFSGVELWEEQFCRSGTR